jgi:hypothetical protein
LWYSLEQTVINRSSVMHVVVHQERVSELLDVLLARWRSIPKHYPFDRKDAVVPQSIIPKEMRQNQFTLACFYFYACIYMRGGIESLQAFSALIKMWRKYPDLFDPMHAAWLQPRDIQPILKEFIGWDSKAASKNWIENSRRLRNNWQSNPLCVIKGLSSYKEALRRIRNKISKRDKKEAGPRNEGFLGFQPKMVSMILYFYDWEGWLKPRFLYPAPADFHNFRLALANRIMVVTPSTATIRSSEKISAPWRKALMDYMKKTGADPIEVSDVLWLFSLTMCGNSPATLTFEVHPLTRRPAHLFAHAGVEEEWDHMQWVRTKRQRLERTCMICPFEKTCMFGIPARPYYRLGLLELRPRPKLENPAPA